MPELPEVETTKRGISSHLVDQTITSVIVRHHQLRLPVAPDLHDLCVGKKILTVSRRAKYLLIELSTGTLIIHLGMSGHLRIVNDHSLAAKHDHIDLCLNDGSILRYHDPRRFGLWLYIATNPSQHRLFSHLGPEPLSNEFDGDYLIQRAYQKNQSIKSFIMNNSVVVGIGNIYATECLFLAGIHPQSPAGAIPKELLLILSTHIKQVLQRAIDSGGTTLRDFYATDGKPGYFATALQVYGRNNLPCPQCNLLIKSVLIAGRTSAFCPQCQPQYYGQTEVLAVLSVN